LDLINLLAQFVKIIIFFKVYKSSIFFKHNLFFILIKKMTDQPAFGHRLPPSTSKTQYIKEYLQRAPPPTDIGSIKDWDSFLDYNKRTDVRKAAASNADDIAKITDKHQLTRFGPYARYDPTSANELGEFFGRKNYAVRHKPEWVSPATAASWLR
jgi:hypothetical protein